MRGSLKVGVAVGTSSGLEKLLADLEPPYTVAMGTYKTMLTESA